MVRLEFDQEKVFPFDLEEIFSIRREVYSRPGVMTSFASYELDAKGNFVGLNIEGRTVKLGNPIEVLEEMSKHVLIIIASGMNSSISFPFLKGLSVEPYVTLVNNNKTEVGDYLLDSRGSGQLRIEKIGKRKVTYVNDISRRFMITEPVISLREIRLLGIECVSQVLDRDLIGAPFTQHLGSPAKTVRDLLLREVPSSFVMPELDENSIKSLLSLSWNCFKGGQWCTEYLGTLGESFAFDQNGSYASNMTELPLAAKCSWIYSKDYNVEAFYGFLRVKGIVECKGLSPILLRLHTELSDRIFNSYSVQGEVSNYFLTKFEYDEIVRLGLGKFQILEGWWGIPNSDYKPFKEILDRLYALRLKALNSGNRFLFNHLKMILASGWGSTAAIYGNHRDGYHPGLLFHPIYAATITGLTRAKVFSLCYPQKGLRGIRLDGGRLQSVDEEFSKITSNGLGGFRLANLNDEIIVDPIHKFTSRQIQQIIDNGDKQIISRRISVWQAATKYGMDRVGDIITVSRSVKPNPGFRKSSRGITLKDLLVGPIPTELIDNRQDIPDLFEISAWQEELVNETLELDYSR